MNEREEVEGATPLVAASVGGHVEAVRALVELGAAVNQAAVGGVDVDGLCTVRVPWVLCGVD
jgi:hypothetical protein